LHSASEKKELLAEHLCVVIERSEQRKSERLAELMKELEMETTTTPAAAVSSTATEGTP